MRLFYWQEILTFNFATTKIDVRIFFLINHHFRAASWRSAIIKLTGESPIISNIFNNVGCILFFFYLLVDEPLQKTLCGIIFFLYCQFVQLIDE